MSSYFLTKDLVQEIVTRVVQRYILPAMANGEVSRQHLHIVAYDPGVKYPDDGLRYPFGPILYEVSLGDPRKWEHDYKAIARSKAFQTWREGKLSRDIQQKAPHLYQKGDTVYCGSANFEGIIVACSGVQNWYDETFAWMIAAALRGEAMNEFAKVQATGVDFIGEEKKQ